jgi:hypothetical protein
MNYSQEFRIYKPYQTDKGAASKIQFRFVQRDKKRGKWAVFWESAIQTGNDTNNNSTFGWKDPEKHVTIMLGLADIAEFLAVLNGVKNYVGPVPRDGKKPSGLFHKNPKGNTSLQFTVTENGDYNFRLSAQRDGKLVAVQHKISAGESYIIKRLMEDAVSRIHSWMTMPAIPDKPKQEAVPVAVEGDPFE